MDLAVRAGKDVVLNRIARRFEREVIQAIGFEINPGSVRPKGRNAQIGIEDQTWLESEHSVGSGIQTVKRVVSVRVGQRRRGARFDENPAAGDLPAADPPLDRVRMSASLFAEGAALSLARCKLFDCPNHSSASARYHLCILSRHGPRKH